MQALGAVSVVEAVPSASWHLPLWTGAVCRSLSFSLPSRGPFTPLKGETIESENNVGNPKFATSQNQ